MRSGVIGEIDGYTPAPAGPSAPVGPSAPTRLSAHAAPSAPPHQAYNGVQTDHLTYDINHIEQESMDIAPPAYESLFGAANSVINRTAAMVTGKGIPAPNTSWREVPEADNHGGDIAVPKQNKTATEEDDEPDTCCDVIWKFACVNILICGIPIAQLVLGMVYMDECPINGGKIQIYLVLNGAVFVLLGMRLWLPNQIDNCWLGKVMNVFAFICFLFLIAWFIVGSVWVFKVYKSVEYEKPDRLYDDRPMVILGKEIDGPFQSNKFKITTKYGTTSQEMKIFWNSNRFGRNTLSVKNYITVCDTTFYDYKDGYGTKMGGVWSFLVTKYSITIWFNDEEALYLTKQDQDNCYFWDKEIKSMTMYPTAFALQFEDEELNKKTFRSTRNDVHYCNKTMYLFAFWLLVLTYVIIGAVGVIAFCM